MINWNDAPEWAVYLAVNYNGKAQWSEDKPVLNELGEYECEHGLIEPARESSLFGLLQERPHD